MPNYDGALMVIGDLNIHVCYPDKPLVTDFLILIDSFNLVQWVSGPIHKHGHTRSCALLWFVCFITLRSVIMLFQTINLYSLKATGFISDLKGLLVSLPERVYTKTRTTTFIPESPEPRVI